jgi:hypothetical protein
MLGAMECRSSLGQSRHVALKTCDFLVEVVAQEEGPMMLGLPPYVGSKYCSHHASLPDLQEINHTL